MVSEWYVSYINQETNDVLIVIDECFITIDDLLPVLESVGHSVKQLAVRNHANHDPLPLDPMLRACPHLTAFTYHSPHHTFSRHGSFPELSLQPNANYPDLEYLSWDVDQRIMPLPILLKQFPHLRSLTIPYRLREHGGQQIELDIIPRHCPDLEYLSFSHSLLVEDDPILPSEPLVFHGKDNGYLTEFRFGDLEGYEGVDMVNLLKTCQEHIQEVKLGSHARPGNPMGGWSELGFLRCEQLRTLELTIACETDDLVRFLQHTPRLEQVTFNGMTQLRNSVLGVLQQRTNLKHVAFYECYGFSEAGMCEFFGTTQAKFEHVTLERCGGGMTNRTLEALGSTHGASLKSLHIAYDGHMDQEGLLDLASSLQVIEKLTINHTMMALTDVVMDALGDIASLAELDITDSVAVTDLGVRSLVDKNKLRYLCLARCMHVGYGTIEYARHVLGRNSVFDGYSK